jgi:hypothetical protein
MSMTIDGTNGITFPNASVQAVGSVGVGQTWTDVKTTPGRLISTTYTNSTGKPICVYVAATCGINTVSGLFVTVNGVALGPGSSYTSGQSQITFIVPDGHTYLVQPNSATPVISYWTELR